MKKMKSIWALLLALALVLTYMPVTAYAASAPTVKSLTLSSGFKVTGYKNCVCWETTDYYKGNSFTVTYSDGTKEKYVFIEDDDHGAYGYYLNGKPTAKEGWLSSSFKSKDPLLSDSNKTIVYTFYDDATYTDASANATVNIVAYDGDVKSIKYECNSEPVIGSINPENNQVSYLNNEDEFKTFAGDKITVVRKGYEENDEPDEVSTTYVCKKTSYNGDSYYAFVSESDSDDEFYPVFSDDQWKNPWKAGDIKTLTVSRMGIIAEGGPQVKVSSKMQVNVSPVLSSWAYTYNGKTHKPKVKAVEVGYWDAGSDDYIVLDKLTSGYKVTKLSSGKKIGYYEVKVKVDTDKYTGDGSYYYNIVPKGVTLKSVTPGKKNLTVKWKKPSASTLKTIDGYYVIYSTSKNFDSNKTKVKKVSKKSTSVKIKNLKSKKNYYVAVYTYKRVKAPWGEKTNIGSNWSNVKKVKVK